MPIPPYPLLVYNLRTYYPKQTGIPAYRQSSIVCSGIALIENRDRGNKELIDTNCPRYSGRALHCSSASRINSIFSWEALIRPLCARPLVQLKTKTLVHWRVFGSVAGVMYEPSFCFWRIFSAVSSLARWYSLPVIVFLVFYSSKKSISRRINRDHENLQGWENQD